MAADSVHADVDSVATLVRASYMLTNYLVTANPWHLEAPPLWWLQKLADTDSDLVVFPSQCRMCHVLARKRRHSNAMQAADKLDKDLLRQSAGMDGDILATHNLVYVRHLIGNTIKRYEIFQWLRDHDIWDLGGAEKASNLIESEAEVVAAQKRKALLEDIDHRARDAWRSYQARTGRRVSFGQKQGYRSAPPAKIMPVGKFTPAESAIAGFYGR